MEADVESTRPMIADWNPQRSLNGFSIGVLCIDSHYPIIPGNVQHAGTFSFPVLYGIVEDVDLNALLAGDRALEPRILRAGQRLLQQGVRVIAGACGSFANYQSVAAAAFRVPTCMSVLTQVPHLLTMISPNQKLLVYFAAASAFTSQVRAECSITEDHRARLLVTQALDLPAFQAFANKPSILDTETLARELFEHASRLRVAHPEIGAVLLQCSDLPPFAHVIQQALRVPVFDVTLIIEWLFRSTLRQPYRGPQ